MWISDFAIRRPIITITVMLAIVAFGLAALMNLQVDEFPDLDQPVVMVQIPYPGASPDVVEREVVEPVEEAIFGLSGIDRALTTSNSVDGLAQFTITFQYTKPVAEASQDVRDAISTIRANLPTGDRGTDHHALRLGRAADPVADALLAHARRAHADHDRRPDDRGRLARGTRGCAGDGDRRVVSGNDHPVASGGDAVGRRRHRRHRPRRGQPEPGGAGWPAQRRAGRARHPAQGAARGRRGIPHAGGDTAQRHAGAPRRCGRCHRRDRGAAHGGDLQWQGRRRHRCQEGEGLFNHAGGRPASCASCRLAEDAPGRCQARDCARRGSPGQGRGRSCAGNADRGCGAHDPRGVPLSQFMAVDGHYRLGAAGVGAGRFHRGLGVRLHAQHHDAARSVAGDRHPDR